MDEFELREKFENEGAGDLWDERRHEELPPRCPRCGRLSSHGESGRCYCSSCGWIDSANLRGPVMQLSEFLQLLRDLEADGLGEVALVILTDSGEALEITGALYDGQFVRLEV